MPFVLVSADPKVLLTNGRSQMTTRVTYGSSSIHESIPELRDIGEYTHDKDTMSWTFKTLPCKLLDRLERIGYSVISCCMKDDLIVWTLQTKV